MKELFSNAYLFCLPSTLEGLPIALLEAMSYGNCCVASDIPENLEEKKEMARTHVLRNYSWDKITDQMEELYLSLLNI